MTDVVLHILTEEPSMEIVLRALVPKVVPGVTFRVYPHQGKKDLEKALADIVPSLSKVPGARILILRDQDDDDCIKVKESYRKKIDVHCGCPYRIRIVCKELESWFLGDLAAIESAYPRSKASGKKIREAVDDIRKPSEQLLRMIPELGKKSRLPKLEVAQSIAPMLQVDRNMSTSFHRTVDALRVLATE